MSIYHSEIEGVGPENKFDAELNRNTIGVLLAMRWSLEYFWPETKDDVEIGFVKGTNSTEICISHNFGWRFYFWGDFYLSYIMDQFVIENYIRCGIRKFIWVIGGRISEETPEELLECVPFEDYDEVIDEQANEYLIIENLNE